MVQSGALMLLLLALVPYSYSTRTSTHTTLQDSRLCAPCPRIQDRRPYHVAAAEILFMALLMRIQQ